MHLATRYHCNDAQAIPAASLKCDENSRFLRPRVKSQSAMRYECDTQAGFIKSMNTSNFLKGILGIIRRSGSKRSSAVLVLVCVVVTVVMCRGIS